MFKEIIVGVFAISVAVNLYKAGKFANGGKEVVEGNEAKNLQLKLAERKLNKIAQVVGETDTYILKALRKDCKHKLGRAKLWSLTKAGDRVILMTWKLINHPRSKAFVDTALHEIAHFKDVEDLATKAYNPLDEWSIFSEAINRIENPFRGDQLRFHLIWHNENFDDIKEDLEISWMFYRREQKRLRNSGRKS